MSSNAHCNFLDKIYGPPVESIRSMALRLSTGLAGQDGQDGAADEQGQSIRTWTTSAKRSEMGTRTRIQRRSSQLAPRAGSNWAHFSSTFIINLLFISSPLPLFEFLHHLSLASHPFAWGPTFISSFLPVISYPRFSGSLYLFIPPRLHCVLHEVKSSDVIILCSSYSCCLWNLSVLIRFSSSHTHRERERGKLLTRCWNNFCSRWWSPAGRWFDSPSLKAHHLSWHRLLLLPILTQKLQLDWRWFGEY